MNPIRLDAAALKAHDLSRAKSLTNSKSEDEAVPDVENKLSSSNRIAIDDLLCCILES